VDAGAVSFHYTDALTRVLADIAQTLPEFAHVDPAKVCVSYTMARKRTPYGVFAKTVPLAGVSRDRPFPGGGRFELAGRPILYIVYVYLPRFHDQSFEDKLMTLIHEMWHMAPEFDGTLLLFPGRNYAHGHSRDEFEAHLEPLTRDYIRKRNGERLLDFLKLSTEDLARSYGRVTGLSVPMP
jgi:hypothetical protein